MSPMVDRAAPIRISAGLTVDPGEMNTAMHAAALPDADPATLTDPVAVAARIVEMIRWSEALPSGARLEVSSWAPPAPRAAAVAPAVAAVRG